MVYDVAGLVHSFEVAGEAEAADTNGVVLTKIAQVTAVWEALALEFEPTRAGNLA